MDDLSLAAEFPTPTREQWLALVERVLKGADLEKKLVSHTYEGIRIEPLYPKAERAVAVPRGETGRWRISQRVDHPDPAAANALALTDLEGGADALTLVFRDAPASRGFGLPFENVDNLEHALSGVMIDLIHVRLDAGLHGREAMALIGELAERRGHALADLQLDLGLDPLGAAAGTGRLSAPWDVVAKRCAENLRRLADRGFVGRAFLADGRPYHEGGAGEAQELAAVLATGVAYLRALEAGGHSLEAARDSIAFLLVSDADQFLTIAKFRALRRLWADVEKACGLTPKPLRLHAETAWRMTTRRDPWVNLLRTTIATFSAGIGGADAVTVLPFTTALGLPDEFARRLARNIQHILLEESNLWRVADPAAGAGAFEALTDALCQKAWAAFQEIEAEGGMAQGLAAGALQARIAETRAARDKALATGKDPITGTSAFPSLAEEPVTVLMPFPGERARPEAAAEGIAVTPLPSTRLAEPFERLRERSDAHLARTGARPKVLLVNLGSPAAFTARSSFAKNFFEAGGIEAVEHSAAQATKPVTAAAAELNAKLICLCSSDEVYAVEAVSVSSTLTNAGFRSIYMAGRPGALQEELERVGLTKFIFAGCDTLRILAEALKAAGA